MRGAKRRGCAFVCAQLCVSACSAVLKGCQFLVVSAGSFLSGLLERCQQPEGIQPGLALQSLWMREPQQVVQCVKHGINKDFIPLVPHILMYAVMVLVEGGGYGLKFNCETIDVE